MATARPMTYDPGLKYQSQLRVLAGRLEKEMMLSTSVFCCYKETPEAGHFIINECLFSSQFWRLKRTVLLCTGLRWGPVDILQSNQVLQRGEQEFKRDSEVICNVLTSARDNSGPARRTSVSSEHDEASDLITSFCTSPLHNVTHSQYHSGNCTFGWRSIPKS